MSVKDILARAASKGLLDDLVAEKSKKEEKKQPKVTQRRNNITGDGMKPKIAELLHHQTASNIKAEVSTSKAVSNVQQKKVNRANGYVQLKKSVNPVSDTALPRVLKHTSHLPSVGKAHERQTLARKARAERKRVVLKTVEIVLPPVITPYATRHGIKPTHPCFRGWTGAKGLGGRVPPAPVGGRILPPALSKAVRPTVLSHPRPWL